MIVNLINNAIDAVQSCPEKWIRLAVFEEGRHVVLKVTDSGLGIPSEVKDKLFDPFFTTKKTGEGTGLGLSISKGILNEHNASISIEEDSPTTCFTIRFEKYLGDIDAD